MELYPAYAWAIYLGPVFAIMTMYDPQKVMLAVSVFGDEKLKKIVHLLPALAIVAALLWPLVAVIKLVMMVAKKPE